MSHSLQERLQMFQGQFASSFDLCVRYVEIQQQNACLVFLSSLSDNELLKAIIEGFVFTNTNQVDCAIYPASVSETKQIQVAYINVLAGQCVVLFEHQEEYYCVETRRYPSRASSEPSIEKSIRGAHDGFVENIIFNVGLIRRRIRNPNLMISLYKVGTLTNSDLAIVYMRDRVDQTVLRQIQEKIQCCDTKEVINGKDVCNVLFQPSLNPYPHVRYSERPDLCAIHLLQGNIVLLMDNDPSAMIAPTTIFEHLNQMEEYTQTPLIANVMRLLRIVCVLFSLYLLPLWIACMMDQNPTMLHLPLTKQGPLEFAFQVLFAECVVEWIRQSLIHTPTMLSQIMSFVAVFVLGEMAIKQQAYTEEILIMVALCNLGNLLTPSYECSLANKVFRVFMEVCSLMFGMFGFCIGAWIHVVTLLHTKTFHKPYLYPIIPFSYKEIKRMIKLQKIYKN